MTNDENSSQHNAGPQSEEDWAIHSLNIHGDFFERWCGHIVSTTPPWTLATTKYPVAVDGHQSELDIRAETELGNTRLVLLVECKKNNPDFVDWVFFRKDVPRSGDQTPVILPHFVENGNAFLEETSFAPIPVTIADGARETRGSYISYKQNKHDKTKTSNTAITDAARQIALATQFVWSEERRRTISRNNARQTTHHTIIIPVIVTTARILVCDFDARDVSSKTGELPYKAAKLSESRPILVYEYPLPTHLHPEIRWAREEALLVRRQIIIVHSAKWASFLMNQGVQVAIALR